MPIVTAAPRSNSNGEVVTEFLDTVNTIPTTYTFLNTQERLKIKNNGYGSLQLTVNGSAVTVLPSESKEFYGSIDSFVITSSGGVQSFEVVGTNYKDEEFKLNGSINKLALPIKAASTDQFLVLPFTSRQVLIINDGGDSLNVAFDGNSTAGQSYPFSDPAWTFTGTWNNSSVGGSQSKYSSATSNAAVLKTTKKLVKLTWDLIKGNATGIAKLELSNDGGATWKNPSDIAGVSRSDAAIGTNMNTYDCYDTSASLYSSLSFNVPYDEWVLRITVNGTKNASSTNTQIFVRSGSITDGSVFTVKVNESLALDIQTTQINVSSPTSADCRVIAI